jgi:hypothetical protein
MLVKDHLIPYWAKLLLAWEQRGGAGLTLPFLLGVQTLTKTGFYPSVTDAECLLQEIFASGIKGRTIGINWCGITKAYGICLIKGETTDGIYLPTPARVFAIDLVCQEFGSQPEEIIHGITGLYSAEILNRTYSITSGKWRSYDEADKTFIQLALADQ